MRRGLQQRRASRHGQVSGGGRWHYRLFCLLDNGTGQQLAEREFDRPQIAVMVKQHMTEFSDCDYRKHVRDPGDRYLATLPRPIALDDT